MCKMKLSLIVCRKMMYEGFLSIIWCNLFNVYILLYVILDSWCGDLGREKKANTNMSYCGIIWKLGILLMACNFSFSMCLEWNMGVWVNMLLAENKKFRWMGRWMIVFVDLLSVISWCLFLFHLLHVIF